VASRPIRDMTLLDHRHYEKNYSNRMSERCQGLRLLDLPNKMLKRSGVKMKKRPGSRKRAIKSGGIALFVNEGRK